MYGTIARMQAKPGAEGQFLALSKEFEGMKIPGHQGTYIYRSEADPNTFWMAVAFAVDEIGRASCRERV